MYQESFLNTEMNTNDEGKTPHHKWRNYIINEQSYNNINIDTMRSIDQILAKWKENRRDISRNVTLDSITNPWQHTISQSENCTCNIEGNTSIKGNCIGCTIVSRLYKNGIILLNKIMTCLVGKNIGLQYITYSIKNCTPRKLLKGYIQSDYPKNNGSKIMNHVHNMQACETSFVSQVQSTLFYSSYGTYEEHYAMISSIIEYEMCKIGIPCTPTFLWMWKCINDIGIIEKIPNLGRGTFKNISNDLIYLTLSTDQKISNRLQMNVGRGLIYQLASSLHFLSLYAFMHSEPSINYLSFNKESTTFIYKNVKIYSPITLNIIPCGTSSISLIIPDSEKIIRLFHPGPGIVRSINTSDFPKIGIHPFIGIKNGSIDDRCESDIKDDVVPCLSGYLNKRILGYKIGDNFNTFSHYIKVLGLPLFHNSFDLYMFLLSLMCEELFYQYLINDYDMLELWKSLFVSDEYDDFMNDIDILRNQDSRPSNLNLLNVLSTRTLRCDAVKHFWAGLEKMQ